jgi:large subunit ribosomal protein L21
VRITDILPSGADASGVKAAIGSGLARKSAPAAAVEAPAVEAEAKPKKRAAKKPAAEAQE